jgi:hypothetical protein
MAFCEPKIAKAKQNETIKKIDFIIVCLLWKLANLKPKKFENDKIIKIRNEKQSFVFKFKFWN